MHPLLPIVLAAVTCNSISGEPAGCDSVVGMRVLLRYDRAAVSVETAREMAGVVDRELARISAQLGCSTRERIVTIAHGKDAYRSAGTPEWSGGAFDGRIHVPVFDSRLLDDNLRRTLAHETVHACLAMLGRWPAWVHEGIAQHVSGETLTPAGHDRIAALVRTGKLPPLAKLSGDWSGLNAETARLAYEIALCAIEIFNRDFGIVGLRNLLRDPSKLPYYTAEIDRRLAQVR